MNSCQHMQLGIKGGRSRDQQIDPLALWLRRLDPLHIAQQSLQLMLFTVPQRAARMLVGRE